MAIESDVHKLSIALKDIGKSAHGSKRLLSEILNAILTKNPDGSYPWQSFSWVVPHSQGQIREDKFRTFDDYLYKWSEFSFEELCMLFADDQKIRTMLSEAKGELALHGTNQHGIGHDNIMSTSTQGTDPTYIVRRLLRDDPALADRVKSGELSPHAAAVQAGFRKPTISITNDPASAARSIVKKFGLDFARQLKDAL